MSHQKNCPQFWINIANVTVEQVLRSYAQHVAQRRNQRDRRTAPALLDMTDHGLVNIDSSPQLSSRKAHGLAHPLQPLPHLGGETVGFC